MIACLEFSSFSHCQRLSASLKVNSVNGKEIYYKISDKVGESGVAGDGDGNKCPFWFLVRLLFMLSHGRASRCFDSVLIHFTRWRQ